MSSSPTVVLTFGTFDLFHEGHRAYLRQAREQGDRLVCVIARDATVKRVKGRAPEHSEQQRLASVRDSGLVDKVRLGSTEDVYSVLSAVRPDIVCLGYDQQAFTGWLRQELDDRGLSSTNIVRMEAYKADVYKTSLLRTS